MLTYFLLTIGDILEKTRRNEEKWDIYWVKEGNVMHCLGGWENRKKKGINKRNKV